jgi:hypothetical protein
MDFITIGGTAGKRDLSEFLNDKLPGAWLLALEGEEGAPVDTIVDSDMKAAAEGIPEMIPDGGTVIVEANCIFEGVRPALALVFLELPYEELSDAEQAAVPFAELALVDWGPGFGGSDELVVERGLKAMGARKVLFFSDEEGRRRAYGKVLDVARSRLGGCEMAEDVPGAVIEAIREAAPEGRIECERAQALARELGVEISVVGRALDLEKIKIISCQLGCF